MYNTNKQYSNTSTLGNYQQRNLLSNNYYQTQGRSHNQSYTNNTNSITQKPNNIPSSYNNQYAYQQSLKNQPSNFQSGQKRLSNLTDGIGQSNGNTFRVRNVPTQNTDEIEKRSILIRNQTTQQGHLSSYQQKQMQLIEQKKQKEEEEEQKANYEKAQKQKSSMSFNQSLSQNRINPPPQKLPKSNKGITGLNNIGNTCFMNSALQCLFNLPEFNDYFLDDKFLRHLRPNNKGIANQYAKLLKNVRSSGGGSSYYSRGESTYDLKRVIEKVAPIFSGYGQQDAQEFLRCCIDGLHEDLNRIIKKPPYRELQADLSRHDIKHISHDWFNYYKHIDDSVIQDFFRGQLSNKVICNKCGYESLAFDTFLDISLAFSGRASILHNVSLEQLIQVFLNKEDQVEEYFCSKCKKQRNCSRQFEFFKMPNILVFHLKRFKFGKSIYSSGSKINHYVSFPVTGLNMSKYKQSSDDSSFDDALYDLVGMVNHSGSLSGGHYTAECMNPYDHRWYRFNDSHVSEVNIDQTQYDTSGSPSPYILFYVKRNLHKN